MLGSGACGLWALPHTNHTATWRYIYGYDMCEKVWLREAGCLAWIEGREACMLRPLELVNISPPLLSSAPWSSRRPRSASLHTALAAASGREC